MAIYTQSPGAALEQIAAGRDQRCEPAENDSNRPLALQHLWLNATLQLTPLSPPFRHLNTTDFDSVDGLNHLNKESKEVPILHLIKIANVHMRAFK
jgi:hypothetical protein